MSEVGQASGCVALLRDALVDHTLSTWGGTEQSQDYGRLSHGRICSPHDSQFFFRHVPVLILKRMYNSYIHTLLYKYIMDTINIPKIDT